LPQLTHLDRLEAESLHIIREVAAECENPVMLYSVGKDSAVMLHLAMKAFYPSRPPFPLMHVDTTWKFREMIEFRDRKAAEMGMDLIVHINEDGVREGIGPFSHGSAVHTDVMKTQALKQALDKYKFSAAFGGARRDEEKSRAKERIFSFRSAEHRWDPNASARRSGISTIPASIRERVSGCSRCRTGPSWTSGNISAAKASKSCRSTLLPNGRW
jgi:sulfate adenylyltransferase subunit 2